MLQHQRIFELSQLASLPDEHEDDCIVDWSLARESDLIVFLTERSSDIFSIALNDGGHGDPSHALPPKEIEENAEGEASIRSLKWYEDLDLRPVCLSFSPGEDYAVIATFDGSLFVVPVQLLVQNHAPGCAKGKIMPITLFVCFGCFSSCLEFSGSYGPFCNYILFQVTHAPKKDGEPLPLHGYILKSVFRMAMSRGAGCHHRCCGTPLVTRASPLQS